jgi:hypothetical protein
VSLVASIGVAVSLPPFPVEGTAKEKTTRQKLAGIDYAGAVFLVRPPSLPIIQAALYRLTHDQTLTIVLFLYGLSGTIAPIPLLISLATLAIFLLIETLVASDPIIPLQVLRSRGVLLTCIAQQCFMASRWSILYYAPIFAQAVRGLPPAAAGAVLVPTNLGFGLGGLVVGALHIRRAGSFWLPSLIALLFFASTFLAAAGLSNAASPWGWYVAAIFANGLATGAALNYTLAHLLHLTRPADHFVATALLNTFRGFAGSFGTAIGGGAFARTLRGALAAGFRALDGGGLTDERRQLVERLVGSPALVHGGGLGAAEQAVAVAGYEDALRKLYWGAAGMSVLVVLIQAGTGWTAPTPAEEDPEEVRRVLLEQDAVAED